MILQLAFCSYLNALRHQLALSMKAVMAPSMRAHRSKLLLDGNRAKSMQRGDRPASGHASASGSRQACVFRAGTIPMPVCRWP